MVALSCVIDFDVDLMAADFDTRFRGDDDWPGDLGEDGAAALVGFFERNHCSGAQPVERGLFRFGNAAVSGEGKNTVGECELAQLTGSMGQREKGLRDGIDDFTEFFGGLVARFTGDYQDGRMGIGEHGSGEPIGDFEGGSGLELKYLG